MPVFVGPMTKAAIDTSTFLAGFAKNGALSRELAGRRSMSGHADARAVFLAALDCHGTDEQNRFLEQACGADAALRTRVEELLRAHRDAGAFLCGAEKLDATSDQPITERPGSVIGPYKLLEQIGEGGFGVVFMAEQQEPIRRKVALKVLKPGMDTRPVIARFEAERQALALMDHPNIARVFDGGTTESSRSRETSEAGGTLTSSATGRPYFVMELVKGVPITDYCDQAQLTARQRLELFVTVCQAVQHAHQKGIIHRDLKPSNVLVTVQDGTPLVKVIDFGIAKALGQQLTDKTLFTGFAQMIGTPLYMSPEQAALSNVDVDTRSDIYSLGVLLYELLTGTTPFEKERFKEVGYDEMRRIIREEEPPRPSTRISTLGQAASTASANRKSDPRRLSQLCRGELDWIVMKALEKDRNRRYETASAFAADVQRYLRDEPVQACPPSVAYRFRKFARRNKVALVTGGLVALALVMGSAISTWQAIRATEAEGLAETRRDEANSESERAIAAEKLAQTEKAAAERAAAQAEAIQRYLIEGMLISADPELTLGRKLTVLDVLANGESKVDTAFPDQPLVEAAIRHTLGIIYLQLGEYGRAQPHLDRAVKLRTRHLGSNNPDTLHSMTGLGVVLARRGRPRESEDLTRTTIRLQTTALGEEHRDTLQSKHNLVTVLLELGKLEEARGLAEETFTTRKRTLGPAHRDTLVSLENLCQCLQNQGEWGEARKRQEEILIELSKRLPLGDPGLQRVKHNLALMLRREGKLEEARTMLTAVIAGRKETLGMYHPSTLLSQTALAFVWAEQGKLREARKLLEEIKELQVRILGEDHKHTLDTMNDLATVLMRQRQPAQARALLEEVLARRAATLGEEHPAMLAPMMNLAGLLKSQGKLPEARELAEKSLKLSTRTLGRKHPKTVMAMGELAAVLFDQRELQAAFKLNERAIALSQQILGHKHPRTLLFRANQALILSKQGKHREARDLLEQTLKDFENVLGPEHPDTVKTIYELAGMALIENDPRRLREARKRLERIVEPLERLRGPNNPDTLMTQKRLAEILFAMGETREAATRLAKVVEGMTRSYGTGHPMTLEARNNLAVVLVRAEKYDEARKLHEENLELSRHSLGPEHPDTLDTINRLAQVINMQGGLLMIAGKRPEAEQTFRQGLAVIKPVENKFASGNDEYRVSLGQLCQNLARCLLSASEPEPRQVKEAVTLAQKALKLMPQFRLCWNTLALAQYRAGDFKAARTTVDEAMTRSKGGDCRDWFLLAMIQWRQGDKEQARQWFKRAVQQMEKSKSESETARTLRAEAAKVLGIKDTAGSKEEGK
jgi:serine/threonine protein kinase/Flp pilus assembly protein TadD